MNAIFNITGCHRRLAFIVKRSLLKDKQAVSKTDSQHCPPDADTTIMHLQERTVKVMWRVDNTPVWWLVSSLKHVVSASVIRRQRVIVTWRCSHNRNPTTAKGTDGETFGLQYRTHAWWKDSYNNYNNSHIRLSKSMGGWLASKLIVWWPGRINSWDV